MDLPSGLTSRPLTPDDAERVFALMVASETHDAGEAAIDLEDIVSDWQRPSFDLATQSVGVVSGDELVAYAEVVGGRYADATVPPEWRGRGIGTWLAAWTQEEARRQGGSVVGMPVPRGSDGDQLLESLGYHVAWTSWVLELPRGAAIEPQPLPEGYAVRPFQPGEERAVYQTVEDAFNEWPDRTPTAYDDWAARVVRRPGFEPWHLRVVTDRAGEVVGVGHVILSRTAATSCRSRCGRTSAGGVSPGHCSSTASRCLAGRAWAGPNSPPTRGPGRSDCTSGSAWRSPRPGCTGRSRCEGSGPGWRVTRALGRSDIPPLERAREPSVGVPAKYRSEAENFVG